MFVYAVMKDSYTPDEGYQSDVLVHLFEKETDADEYCQKLCATAYQCVKDSFDKGVAIVKLEEFKRLNDPNNDTIGFCRIVWTDENVAAYNIDGYLETTWFVRKELVM